MNVLIGIMLIFACIGLVDKLIGGRFGLAVEVDKGLSLMGSTALGLLGIYCIGLEFVNANTDLIQSFSALFPFDASIIVGSFLAPDMGALPIALEISSSREIGILSGALVGTTLGATICFQLPIFLSVIEKKDVSFMMKGIILGLIVIPVALFAGSGMLGLSLFESFIQLTPIIVICLILSVAFYLAPHNTSKILGLVGNVIKAFTLILFALTIANIYLPKLNLVNLSIIQEAFFIVGKMAIIISGALVFSHIVLIIFRKQLTFIANLLKVNEIAVLGLFLGLTSSLAMLPLFHQMDERGKIMNAAFSVGGAYTLGGQMAFVSDMVSSSELWIYLATKLLAGLSAILITRFFFKTADVDVEKDNQA